MGGNQLSVSPCSMLCVVGPFFPLPSRYTGGTGFMRSVKANGVALAVCIAQEISVIAHTAGISKRFFVKTIFYVLLSFIFQPFSLSGTPCRQNNEEMLSTW